LVDFSALLVTQEKLLLMKLEGNKKIKLENRGVVIRITLTLILDRRKLDVTDTD